MMPQIAQMELCMKALELKQDNADMAMGWLMTEGQVFLDSGGLDEVDAEEKADPRFGNSKTLVRAESCKDLCFKALCRTNFLKIGTSFNMSWSRVLCRLHPKESAQLAQLSTANFE